MNQLTGQQPLTNYQMLSIHHKSSDNSDNSPIIIVRISSRLLTTLNPARLHSLKIGYNLFQSLVDENLSLQLPLKCNSDVEELWRLFLEWCKVLPGPLQLCTFPKYTHHRVTQKQSEKLKKNVNYEKNGKFGHKN